MEEEPEFEIWPLVFFITIVAAFILSVLAVYWIVS